MRQFLCVVVGALLWQCSTAVDVTTKEASASCRIMKDQEDALRIDFRLVLNSDPNNRLVALDQDMFNLAVRQYVPIPDCNINYDSDTKSYHVRTTVDRNPNDGNNRNFNLCDVVSTTGAGNIWSYKILFFHQTGSNNALIEDRDMAYLVTCTSSDSVDNVVVTENVLVIPPSSRPVEINNVIPTLSLWRESTPNSNQYIPLSGPVAVSTRMKIGIHYKYGTFSPTSYYGVAGLQTLVSPLPNFNNAIEFFDSNGCKSSTLAPDVAFSVSNNGATMTNGQKEYTQMTAAFPIWKFDVGPQLFFKVYYGLCHGSSGFDQDGLCINPCNHLTRRRRDIEDEFNSTIIMVEVFDPEATDAEGSDMLVTEKSNGIVIGIAAACVVACAILVILLVAIVLIRRRSSARKEEKHVPQEFVNAGYVN